MKTPPPHQPMTERDMPCLSLAWLEPKQQSIGSMKQTIFFHLRGTAAGNYPAPHNSEQTPHITRLLRDLYPVPLTEQRPGSPGKSAVWHAAQSECQGVSISPRG